MEILTPFRSPCNVNDRSVLRVFNLQTEDAMKKVVDGGPWLRAEADVAVEGAP